MPQDAREPNKSNQDARDAARAGLDRRQFIGIVGAAGIGLATGSSLAGCGSASTTTSNASSPKRGGMLRVGISGGASSDTLNAEKPLTAADYARLPQLYQSVCELDTNAQMKLVLADEMTPNSNATKWTIRLKKGIIFHDGRELTAEDLIYSLRLGQNPNAANVSAQLAPIDGSALSKLDKYTVEVPCKTPYAILPAMLGTYNWYVVPSGYNPKEPIGTGPFKLKSFTPGQESVFVRNEHYWETAVPYLDTLVLTNYSDETSQVNALLGGQVDVIDFLSATSISQLQTNGKVVKVAASGGMSPLCMRADLKPFNDPRVRQALRLIPDRKQSLSTVFLGHGAVANDVFSLYDPNYDRSLPQREQDLEQAKSLLKAAGQEGLSLDLVTAPVEAGIVAGAQVFAQQAQGAGVNVSVRQLTTTAYFNNYLKWPFCTDSWFYYPYLAQVALSTVPGAIWNETHFSSPTYTKLFNEAISTTDQAKQKELVTAMQEIDYNDGAYIIPFFPPVIDGYAANVQGARAARTGYSCNNFALKELWLT